MPNEKKNKVILMVGGLGERLGSLTKDTPKPMLKVGNKSILETIVENFKGYGYTNIVMCLNYKSEIIQDYFGDGSEFGVNIEYIVEEKRMGTAGALSLLKDNSKEPFFVMNGDLLTNVNFEKIHEFYLSNNAQALMCVREYESQVPYGVINIENTKIVSVEEKPTQKFFVNAGIYMLNPEVLKYIPKNEFYNMTTLFEKLIDKDKNIISFPIDGYWLDIGRFEEYKKANEEYNEVF
jgi:NDP-sugar pyrophosphorylase family protein